MHFMGARDYLQKVQDGKDWLLQPQFSIKKLYTVLIGNIQKVSWAKRMCQNSAPAKCLFIAWLLMHDRLATCDYLMKVGVQVDPVCCLCSLEPETVQHLFFKCVVTAAAWKEVMEWCGIEAPATDWSNGRDILIPQCSTNSGKQKLYRCVVTVLIYYSWQMRNIKRMQGKMFRVEEVVHQCKLVISLCGRKDRKIASLLNS